MGTEPPPPLPPTLVTSSLGPKAPAAANRLTGHRRCVTDCGKTSPPLWSRNHHRRCGTVPENRPVPSLLFSPRPGSCGCSRCHPGTEARRCHTAASWWRGWWWGGSASAAPGMPGNTALETCAQTDSHTCHQAPSPCMAMIMQNEMQNNGWTDQIHDFCSSARVSKVTSTIHAYNLDTLCWQTRCCNFKLRCLLVYNNIWPYQCH